MTRSKKINRFWGEIVNVYALASDDSALREVLVLAYCDSFPIAIFFAKTSKTAQEVQITLFIRNMRPITPVAEI